MSQLPGTFDSRSATALKDPSLQATNVTVFGQVEFKGPGNYFVEVLVDDVMKLRYSIPVIHVPQTQPGQQPNPPAPPPDKPSAS